MLTKTANLRNSLQELIEKKGQLLEVQCIFDKFLGLCEDTKSVHNALLEMLPDVEREKHDTWFKAKMMFNEMVISDVKTALAGSELGICDCKTNDVTNNVNKNEIDPDDSASNLSKRSSKGSTCSSHCSTASSARIQAEAERAALLEESRILKEKHAIEEQEQQLKRKKEQLEIDAKLAATAARIAVLEAFENGFKVSAKTMDKKVAADLNPNAKEFKPFITEDHHEKNKLVSSCYTPQLE